MSHFTVAVITKDGNYEAALEPFNENLNVDPYISETREKVIEKYRKHLERNQEEGKEISVSLALTDDQLLEEAKKYYDWETFDENGNIISTYNPKSKWDWWSLGGRWTGLLKLKQPTNLTPEELELKNKLEQEVLVKTIWFCTHSNLFFINSCSYFSPSWVYFFVRTNRLNPFVRLFKYLNMLN